MSEDQKRLRGRPATGRTPDPQRTAKSRADLVATGGKRLSVNLTAQGLADLEKIKAAGGTGDTDATHQALRAFAKKLARRA